MVQQKFDCTAHELRPLGQPDHARSTVPILSRLTRIALEKFSQDPK